MAAVKEVDITRDAACSKSVLVNSPDGAVIVLHDFSTVSRQAYAELDGVKIELPIFFEIENEDDKKEAAKLDLPLWAQWIKKTKKFSFPCSMFNARDAKSILTRIKRPLHKTNPGSKPERLLPNTNWGQCEYFDPGSGNAYGHLFTQ